MIDGDDGTHSSSPYSSPYGSRGSEFNAQLQEMTQIEECLNVKPERLEGQEFDWVAYLSKVDPVKIAEELIDFDCKIVPELVQVKKGVVKLALAVYLISL